MSVKLVMYTTPTMSEVESEIKGFSTAREAAHYRDTHYETAGKPSQIQQDTGNGSGNNNDDMRSENLDDGSRAVQRQVIRYHKGMARENFAQFKAAAILAIVGVGAFISFLLLIFSL